MKRSPTDGALKVVNYLATSKFVDSIGMRKPLEKMIYSSTKHGFKVISFAASKVKAKKKNKEQNSVDKSAHLFDLGYSDEQLLMQDSLKKFATSVVRPQAHDANENVAIADDLQAAFAEIGTNYFAVPEAYGGAATQHSPVTQMLIHETLGNGDMGISLGLLSSIGAANAIARWGSEQQKSIYLPRFLGADAAADAEQASGGDKNNRDISSCDISSHDIKAAIAVQEPRVLFDPQQLTTRAKKTLGGYVLKGEKSIVAIAQQADLFLVAARLNDNKNAVFIVAKNTPGLKIKSAEQMGLKAAGIGRLVLDNVKLKASALLGEGTKQPVAMQATQTADAATKIQHSTVARQHFNYQEFLDFGRLAWCAMAVGVCEAVRDYVIEYCNEREAFGEPISHRQSIAFKIADIATELESMRILTQRATALSEQNNPFQREAYLAKLLCGKQAMQIASDGVQLLGGHGFTKEHPVERWYRDLRVVAMIEGGLHL